MTYPTGAQSLSQALW